MPPTCCARTDTTMLRPGDATAPVVGASSVTLSACTFDRKTTIVSTAKLPRRRWPDRRS